MFIFLAFSLLTEIWVCTHYSISHFASLLISGGWWLILGGGPSNRRRRRLHCQSNVCSGFSLRDVRARFKALRVSLVRLGEALPHVSHDRGLYRTGTGIPIFNVLLTWHPLSIAVEVQLSMSAQKVCTLPPAFKWRVTLVLLSLIMQHP